MLVHEREAKEELENDKYMLNGVNNSLLKKAQINVPESDDKINESFYEKAFYKEPASYEDMTLRIIL